MLFSEEGTTQGDPLALPLYALATIPLINHLSDTSNVVQVWYADDATTSGSLSCLRNWWDNLTSTGPAFSYHPNATKTWLITKDPHLAKEDTSFKTHRSTSHHKADLTWAPLLAPKSSLMTVTDNGICRLHSWICTQVILPVQNSLQHRSSSTTSRRLVFIPD